MKRGAKLCTILVLALLFLAACGEKKSPWQVDYDFFWDTVEENYPYAAAIERINGKSLADVREKYAPYADRAQSAQELYRVLEGCMMEFPELTGHFSILDNGMYQLYMDIIARSPGWAKYDFMKKSLDTPQSRNFYGYQEWKSTGNAEKNQENKVYGNVEIEYLPCDEVSGTVGYVKIYSMLGDWQDGDADLWADLWARMNKLGVEDCIIDIRGNGGGSDTYWTHNIVVPNLVGEVKNNHIALVRGKESVAYLEQAIDEKLPSIKELDVSKYPALNGDDLSLATHYAQMGFQMSRNNTERAFGGRFWLLVDGNVYSSSEAFAVFCKDTGFATLVGTPTGGDGIGIEPLAMALPNSGIAFRFSTLLGLNSDGSCNEEFGTTPDILCKPGEDALELCLNIIKEQGGETR